MPNTETKVYHYNELPENAKQKARNHYIENWVHDDWYDYVYSMAIEDGKKHGFVIDNIYFSGFYSQGDGACWEGSVDLYDFLDSHANNSIGRDCWVWLIADGWIHNSVDIKRHPSHYSHSGCMYAGAIDEYGFYDGYIGLDCIIKGMPVRSVYDLIAADPNCNVKDFAELTTMIETSAKAYADKIYSDLRNSYEWLCTDENISEVYDANEILFNEEGEIV